MEKRKIFLTVDLQGFKVWEKDLIMGSIDFAVKKSLEVIKNTNEGKEELLDVSLC